MSTTMSFKPIIIAAGIDPLQYKWAEFLHITLFDSKDSICSDENITFHRPLFEENPDEIEKFEAFLNQLGNTLPDSTINVMIDEVTVEVYYNTPQAKTFIRRHTLEPNDYMN